MLWTNYPNETGFVFVFDKSAAECRLLLKSWLDHPHKKRQHKMNWLNEIFYFVKPVQGFSGSIFRVLLSLSLILLWILCHCSAGRSGNLCETYSWTLSFRFCGSSDFPLLPLQFTSLTQPVYASNGVNAIKTFMAYTSGQCSPHTKLSLKNPSSRSADSAQRVTSRRDCGGLMLELAGLADSTGELKGSGSSSDRLSARVGKSWCPQEGWQGPAEGQEGLATSRFCSAGVLDNLG